MRLLLTTAVLTVAILSALPGRAAASEERRQAFAAAARQGLYEPALLEARLRYDNATTGGAATLIFGFGLDAAGIALTLIDPFGYLGLAGFISVGTGIAVMAAGMTVLAVSRYAWQKKRRELLGQATPVQLDADARASIAFNFEPSLPGG
ncbi:MAG: hypothetical protein R6V85_15755 [Polyangia bacterium]